MSCPLDKLVITKEMVDKVESTEIIWRKALVKGHVNLWVAPSNGGKTLLASLAARELSGIGYKVYYMQEDAAINDLKEMRQQAEEHDYSLVSSVLGETSTDEILDELRKWTNSDIDLSDYVLIFDTLKKFSEVMHKAESKKFFKLMRTLTVRGATLLLLGHSNKNLTNDGKLIFEGVGDNRNDVDELMYIFSSVSDSSNHITFTITPDKVRSKVEKVSFTFDKDSREVKPLDSAVDLMSELKIQQLHERDAGMIAHIQNEIIYSEQPVTTLVNKVSQAMGIGERKVRACVNRWGPNGLRPHTPLWHERRESLNNKLFIQLPSGTVKK
jgi:archaellum biogenesis ATPase FlaH